MDIQEIVSDRVIELRALFVEAGYDMWLVGGACRDFLSGTKPKDIDLATSATPDEQIAIYEANSIHYIPTGLKHGTISVVLDEVYEITSLRTESEHDGRHATVAYGVDEKMLRAFVDLGFDPDADYSIDDLMEAFRRKPI